MTVETDVPTPSHRADGAAAPVAPAPPAPALPAGNPALLALITFLPSGLTLGLWFIGYLDTATLPGGMVATLALSAGLFMLVATIWAGRIGASTLAAIFGVFSAFWLSFALLVTALTSTWWAIAAAGVARVQATYLLSFLCVFVLLTLATLRLPLVFTVGFVLVDADLPARVPRGGEREQGLLHLGRGDHVRLLRGLRVRPVRRVRPGPRRQGHADGQARDPVRECRRASR